LKIALEHIFIYIIYLFIRTVQVRPCFFFHIILIELHRAVKLIYETHLALIYQKISQFHTKFAPPKPLRTKQQNWDLIKASVVERFNRTLKERIFRIFTHNKNTKYVDILPDILESYNNSYHRSIKTTPNLVTEKNKEEIFKNLYGDINTFSFDNYIKFKFKRGDYVRIANEKNIFDKGYTPNFSKEIYVIWKLIASNPPRYNLRSLDDEEYSYNFYTEELQKVSQSEFPYDSFKIIKESRKEILIEKLNSETENIKLLKKNQIDFYLDKVKV